MSDIVIRADGLGKKYLIGHQAQSERYTALRDVVARRAKGLARSARDVLSGRQLVAGDEVEDFWALKDVSFEIKRGEVVGIIGRNGAGKSTLLKILSRITEPSTGRVEIKGRVASLLEVGTGFHPELTGRENIYLNGAILGMTRAEIRRKFDEIVAFAEIEKFLDTPVKRYSSGMYVRLAFAVAAHLEPEILIVDEVLAVGDADFQNKCLGKMGEVAGQGRTVLFVSYNLSAVRALCARGLVLAKGRVQLLGLVLEALATYRDQSTATATFWREPPYTGKPAIVGVSILSVNGNHADIEVIISARDQASASIDIRLKDRLLNPVGFGSLGAFKSQCPVVIHPGKTSVRLQMLTSQMANGEYILSMDLTHPFVEFFDRVEDCVRLRIEIGSRDASTRNLEQNWGYGSIVIPVITAPSPADASDEKSTAFV